MTEQVGRDGFLGRIGQLIGLKQECRRRDLRLIVELVRRGPAVAQLAAAIVVGNEIAEDPVEIGPGRSVGAKLGTVVPHPDERLLNQVLGGILAPEFVGGKSDHRAPVPLEQHRQRLGIAHGNPGREGKVVGFGGRGIPRRESRAGAANLEHGVPSRTSRGQYPPT